MTDLTNDLELGSHAAGRDTGAGAVQSTQDTGRTSGLFMSAQGDAPADTMNGGAVAGAVGSPDHPIPTLGVQDGVFHKQIKAWTTNPLSRLATTCGILCLGAIIILLIIVGVWSVIGIAVLIKSANQHNTSSRK